jgi:hypothetical protein
MKKLIVLLTLGFCLSSQAVTCKAIFLEKILDSNNQLTEVKATIYINENDGAPIIRHLTTAQQLLKVTSLFTRARYANPPSKAIRRVFVYFNSDGSIDRINTHAVSSFEDMLSHPGDVQQTLIDDTTSLKSDSENDTI